jgi:hypothetical protein
MDIIPKSTPTRIDFPMMDITMMDMFPSDAGLTAQGREWAGNVAEGVWNVPLYLGKRKRPVEQSPGKVRYTLYVAGTYPHCLIKGAR